MLTIIAHHYVVNSGVTDCYDFQSITGNMIFLQLWGMWGKTAINGFILISGYFMCTSYLTVRRYAKVYLAAKFYSVVIFVILALLGWQVLTFKEVFKCVFGFIWQINSLFIGSFLAFYMFIPFYNALLEKLAKKQLQQLICMLILTSTVASTFFFSSAAFTEVGWYMTLYFMAAYIRRYPAKWMNNNKVCGSAMVGTVLPSYLSIIIVDFVGVNYGFDNYYYMASNSNKIFAFMCGILAFLIFNNIDLVHSKIINTVASTTFGVLCIHANSDAMRTFLWTHLLNVRGMYNAPFGMLVLHAVASMLGGFCICSVIDLVRIRWIEKPVMALLDRLSQRHMI